MEESSSSNEEDDDDEEEVVECPVEKRATRKRTFSFPGSHMHVMYTKQLVYHERSDMKKSPKGRKRSDSCGNKPASSVDEEKSVDIRRGRSMPAMQEIQEELSPNTSGEDEEKKTNGDVTPVRPTFGCGDVDDDFTGLEDESPAIMI